jgi:glycosyltransferase involved in cell wall biosynthesis
MAELLGLPLDRMHLVPLGIDLTEHDGLPREQPHDPFTIGFFARICPEKGLQHLLSAFRIVRTKHPEVRLKAGGYLGARDKLWFRDLQRQAADLGSAFEYIGSPPDHAAKVEFFKSVDVLSVPTEYREPKGLYVLEALANGVPVVQPRHGAFPELIAATGGGLLVNPLDPPDLAAALDELIRHPLQRFELATAGRAAVHSCFDPRTMADATRRALEASTA